MESCYLHLQAAKARNAQEANVLSARCSHLMAEYEKISESLMEVLKGEKAWVSTVAPCLLSLTPPTLPPPDMQALVDGGDDDRTNAAPDMSPEGDEQPTEITGGWRLLTLQWFNNSETDNSLRDAHVIVMDPMGNPCVHPLPELLTVKDLRLCRLAAMWPDILLLDLVQPALSINEFLTWMKKCTKETTTGTEPIAGRFRPASETDMNNFSELVSLLRDRRCVSHRCSRLSCPLMILTECNCQLDNRRQERAHEEPFPRATRAGPALCCIPNLWHTKPPAGTPTAAAGAHELGPLDIEFVWQYSNLSSSGRD
jgi:hypothetical protein